MNNARASAWWWQTDGGIKGLKLDEETSTLHWFDDPTSLCGDDGSQAEQSFEAFRHAGPPAFVGTFPEEIQEAVLYALERRSAVAREPA